MKTINHNLNILPEAQRELWNNLAPCKDLGFVLYGGTAISLYFGHRISVDFDFFSDIELDTRQEEKLLQALPFLENSEIIQNELNTRTFSTESKVKLSFFGGLNFGRIDEPSLTNDNVLQVASLYDLLGIKLKVIMQRAEVKDYKDIAIMLDSGMSLEKGLACSSALYGNQFPPLESIRALTYFQDGNLNLLTNKEKNILISAVNKVQIQQLPKIEILSYSLGTEVLKASKKEAIVNAREKMGENSFVVNAKAEKIYKGEIITKSNENNIDIDDEIEI